MSSTDTLTRHKITAKPQTGSGKPIISHICEKDDITDAYVFGTPLVALCGYTWVPSRDPKSLPLCPACKDIAESMWGVGSSPE
jgi:hypothetical protein